MRPTRAAEVHDLLLRNRPIGPPPGVRCRCLTRNRAVGPVPALPAHAIMAQQQVSNENAMPRPTRCSNLLMIAVAAILETATLV